MTGVVSINDEVVCLLNYRFVAITADVPHGYLGALDISASTRVMPLAEENCWLLLSMAMM